MILKYTSFSQTVVSVKMEWTALQLTEKS